MELILSLERCHRYVMAQTGNEIFHVGRAVCRSMPTPLDTPLAWTSLFPVISLWQPSWSFNSSFSRAGRSNTFRLRATFPWLCLRVLFPRTLPVPDQNTEGSPQGLEGAPARHGLSGGRTSNPRAPGDLLERRKSHCVTVDQWEKASLSSHLLGKCKAWI